MIFPDNLPASLAGYLLPLVLLGGLITAIARLADINTPVDTGLLHGRVGALCTVLLLLSLFSGDEAPASVTPALLLLLATLSLGVALYYIIRRRGVLPTGVILLHAAFAFAALYSLFFHFPFA